MNNDITTAKALATSIEKDSELERLLSALSYTNELIGLLEKRLNPVSNPEPRSDQRSIESNGFHIASATNQVRMNNDDLNTLINSLVI